jgi:DNA-directed RNA polymerase specialized sigma24 family protein
MSPEVMDWIQTAARLQARGPDAEDLAQAAIERMLRTGRPVPTRSCARVLVRSTRIDLYRTAKSQRRMDAQGTVSRELPEPPEDRSSLSIQAYVLECRALGASDREIALELEKSRFSVYARRIREHGTRLNPEQKRARTARARGHPIV